MTARKTKNPAAEASAWFARLGQKNITTAEVWAFARWRDDPTNDAAYTALETRYLDPRRYEAKASATGFRVADIWTGETVVIAWTAQDDMSQADAVQIAEMLNRRSARGDRSILQ